jgi:predicted regulator of Ras-like GTPase activity (Roadblock/LC7/MglB family)
MSDLSAGSRSERLDGALSALLTQTPELEAAAVVSFDGLPMAAALPAGMDEDRVAAMSAALLSLGERATQGLGRGDLSQVYIEGETGTVYLVSCDDEAVLVAVASKGAKVGMMLFEVRRAAAVIADVLREDEPEVAPPPVPVFASAAPAVPAAPAPEPVLQAVPSVPQYAAPAVPAQPTEPAPAHAASSPRRRTPPSRAPRLPPTSRRSTRPGRRRRTPRPAACCRRCRAPARTGPDAPDDDATAAMTTPTRTDNRA